MAWIVEHHVSLLVAATLVLSFIEFCLRVSKPRVVVRFPDGKRRWCCAAGDDVEIVIVVRNAGHRHIGNGDFSVYYPTSFEMSEFIFLNQKQAGPGIEEYHHGANSGMRYYFTGPKFVMRQNDEEMLRLVGRAPQNHGTYDIKVNIFSSNGERDLGSHVLQVICSGYSRQSKNRQ